MQRWIMRVLGLAGMLCCLGALAGTSAAKPVDIRDLMNVNQFDASGLNKLSPDEIKALNLWLNQYLDTRSVSAPAPGPTPDQVPVPVPQADALSARPASSLPPETGPSSTKPASSIANFGADTMTPKETPGEPTRIESRIAGLFTGWTGDTVFKLENGQIWQQAATGYYTDVKLDHPQVVIKKLTFGYLLTLPGHGQTVFVRRVK
jgi:hypothetical protein